MKIWRLSTVHHLRLGWKESNYLKRPTTFNLKYLRLSITLTQFLITAQFRLLLTTLYILSIQITNYWNYLVSIVFTTYVAQFWFRTFIEILISVSHESISNVNPYEQWLSEDASAFCHTSSIIDILMCGRTVCSSSLLSVSIHQLILHYAYRY